MKFFTLAALVALATASECNLTKRCSPIYDPEYAIGYLPPVACWHDFDPGCQPYIRDETQMLLDPPHHFAAIFGVSENCMDQIAEEQRRVREGLKNYGWEAQHGNLTNIGDGILVISNMPEAAVTLYQSLTYYPQ